MPVIIESIEASLLSIPTLDLNTLCIIATDAQSAFVMDRKDSSVLKAQAESTTIDTLKVSLNISTHGNCLTKSARTTAKHTSIEAPFTVDLQGR